MRDQSWLLPSAAFGRAPSRPAPLPPPPCGCAYSLPPVRLTGAPVARGASAPLATPPYAQAPSSPVRCSRTPVPPAAQSPEYPCLPYTSQSLFSLGQAPACQSVGGAGFSLSIRAQPRLLSSLRSLRLSPELSASRSLPC